MLLAMRVMTVKSECEMVSFHDDFFYLSMMLFCEIFDVMSVPNVHAEFMYIAFRH